jgi:pimeloyl-ACP methyl ester carboxylesterase
MPLSCRGAIGGTTAAPPHIGRSPGRASRPAAEKLAKCAPTFRQLVPAVIAALLLSACVPNQAWRIHYMPGQPPAIDPPLFEQASIADCDSHPRSGTSAYRLAFVEFDDRGEFFERSQLEQALRLIRQVKETASAKYPAAVVLFVHGWKNNASDRSGNVAGFKKMLTCLGPQFNPSEAPAEQTRVVGIYLGWRGAVVDAPVVKELTFWDRRDESRNLPGAQVVEALLSIMKTAKGERYSEATVSILIGHSFGGGLLETALTQTLENIILDTPSGQPISWPNDLTVLINEAAPASQSYQLIESMEANIRPRPPCGPGESARVKTERYMPAVISMTSAGDWGTGTAFPIGQALSRPFNSLRTYPHPNAVGLKNQTEMYLKTTVFTKSFISHILDTDANPAVVAAISAGCQVELVSDIFDAKKKKVEKYQMVEKPASKNLSPYWVIEVPTPIVPDHTTIFEAPFRSLMIDLVMVKNQFPGEPYVRK